MEKRRQDSEYLRDISVRMAVASGVQHAAVLVAEEENFQVYCSSGCIADAVNGFPASPLFLNILQSRESTCIHPQPHEDPVAASLGVGTVHSLPVWSEGGSLLAHLLVLQDVVRPATPRVTAALRQAAPEVVKLLSPPRRTYAELARSEQRLAGILNIAGDAIIAMDVSGKVLMFNRGAESIFGYIAEEVVGQPLAILLPEAIRAAHAGHVKNFCDEDATARTMNTRRPITGRRKDGSLFPAEAGISKLVDGDDTLLTVYLRDITARVKVEEEAARLGRLLDRSSNEILVFDRATLRVVYGNRGALNNLQYTETEIREKHLYDLEYQGEDRFLARWRRLHDTQAEDVEYETEQQRKDGSRYPVVVRLDLVSSEHPPVGVAFISDLSEHKHLEQQLFQSQRLEAIGRFTGGIAHDFNNLLVPISAYSDMLQESFPVGSRERHYVDGIRESSERAAALVRHLLSFGRGASHGATSVNPASVLRDMERVLHPILGERIQLDIQSAPGIASIFIDPGQLEQVIVNLAMNAHDAMPGGGTFRIHMTNTHMDNTFQPVQLDLANGDYVLFEVSDNGVGMDAETCARIFEPFFTTKGPGLGTGLGLSTAYSIVKQSGGNIWVYSEIGRGSIFKIYLPAGTNAAVKAKDTRAATEYAGTERILLIDDSVMVRASVEVTLRRLGYDVVTSTSAMHALEVLRNEREHLDLVMTDLVMPELSGIDMARYVRELRPGTPVLFMSGYVGDRLVGGEQLPKEEMVITKPFSSAALSLRLREILDSPRRGLTQHERS